MSIENRGRSAGQRTLTAFEASTDVVRGYGRLLNRRRSQRRNRAVAVAAAIVVAVFVVFTVQGSLSADSQPEPMQPAPGIDIPDVPVWFDAAGLHRGRVIEQVPTQLEQHFHGSPRLTALALVRTGALYLDSATREVWFHPWGGEPRIVGHNSPAGAGGDPDGDLAAWFEKFNETLHERTELVIYDTATGQEVSRTEVSTNTAKASCCSEHVRGNGFLQVSNERIVWNHPGHGVNVFDVKTGTTSVLKAPPEVTHGEVPLAGAVPDVVDVYDDSIISQRRSLILSTPSIPVARYPQVEPYARFSATGNFFLSVTHQHSGAIVNTTTGELWRVPKNAYPWIAWSYGDTATIDHMEPGTDTLLACNAAHQTCQTLPAKHPVLLPTS